jgi:hypothetical protein
MLQLIMSEGKQRTKGSATGRMRGEEIARVSFALRTDEKEMSSGGKGGRE